MRAWKDYNFAAAERRTLTHLDAVADSHHHRRTRNDVERILARKESADRRAEYPTRAAREAVSDRIERSDRDVHVARTLDEKLARQSRARSYIGG